MRRAVASSFRRFSSKVSFFIKPYKVKGQASLLLGSPLRNHQSNFLTFYLIYGTFLDNFCNPGRDPENIGHQ